MERPTFLSEGAIELHDIAAELSPSVPGIEEHLLKNPHVLVAVQRHDRDAERWVNAESKDKFLWIKARQKIKFSQIRDSYLNSYRNHSPNLSVILKLDGSIPSDETRIGELDHFMDRVIAFQALSMDGATSDGPNPGTPFHGLEMTYDHAPSTEAPDHTLRQPLQPVNRQLSVPKLSVEASIPVKHEPSLEDRENLVREWVNVDRDSGFHQSSSPPPNFSLQVKVENGSAFSETGDGSQAAVKQEFGAQDFENPFTTHDDDPEAFLRGQPLQELSQSTTVERLEAGVKAGVDILTQLQLPLERLGNDTDAQNWLQQVQSVRKEAARSRTVVGVVGNTGAGKSSVINAMLDEERLVPTNCMRACTAVVTELSYNYSASEASKYRAEVEFIQPEDWRKELKVLFEEVFDENGQMFKEAFNADSQAGIAYAKIRAVYHKHTKEMLGKATVDSLMQLKSVQNILGTTRRINEKQPEPFYHRLQQYVDSKEKGTEKLDKNGNKITNPKRVFEFWPLIKVVKIYTKADALSSGAIIVDLPGVHDSNAARAAVAESYMKQCSGLWIVAPINRAVDDKAAKSLLGNAFKRQLKYDGTYSAVTFICSKTDDISRTEAADTLHLGAEMDEIEGKLVSLERQRKDLLKQLNTAKENKQDHSNAIEDIDDQLEVWEDLKERLEDGQTVYEPPASGAKKRKRDSKPSGNRKKRRRNSDAESDDEYNDDDSISEDDEANDAVVSSGPVLSQDQVDEKVEELKRLKRDARRERGSIDDQLRELRQQLSHVKAEETELDARSSEICIAGRNEYSRSAIRLDFAAGIKELDQENAEEEDPDNFNPDDDMRDYDEVARSLPVYCVSSRAYQKLSGRMQKDSNVPGFTTKEQTEVPQLQAHCKSLTEGGRQANCRRFLHSLNQLFNSLGLWASDDGTGAKLTTQQRDTEKDFLVRRLKELERALEKAVAASLDHIEEHLSDGLFEKFQPAVDTAVQQAVPTSSSWGAKRDQGGLHYMTYKATVRRDGVYQGASGFRDFNAQLTEPIIKQLASSWEKSFQRRIPHILQKFPKIVADLLKKFHAAIEKRCIEKGHGIGRIGVLGTQLKNYEAIFNDVAEAMRNQVNEAQREINREFTPVIKEAMGDAYQLCTDERGTGSYKRMKAHMQDHVETSREHMFSEACNQVRNRIMAVCQALRDTMLDRADAVFVSMQRDFMFLIGGVHDGRVSMPREERSVRRELEETMSAVDQTFQEVLDVDLADLQQAGGEAQVVDGMDIDGDEADNIKTEDDFDDNSEGEEEDGEEGGQSAEDWDEAEAEHSVDGAGGGGSGYEEV